MLLILEYFIDKTKLENQQKPYSIKDQFQLCKSKELWCAWMVLNTH